MQSQPTTLFLPEDIPRTSYPVTILSLLQPPNSTHASSSSGSKHQHRIKKRTALFRYAVLTATEDGNNRHRESRLFESPIEGLLAEWCVKAGQVVRDPKYPMVKIIEPCLHIRQFHGMCTDCGAVLTDIDYTGYSDLSRATVRMSHDDEELLVSRAEAERIEKDTADRLLAARKLSLIVDLDQTVIHATVDPTVGDWMHQPENPNFEALKGVSTFKLGKDGSATSSDSVHPEDGCAYYVKSRPGLTVFLESISELYEMHVYTMGTRGYAEAVCRVIDPHSRLFGGRILSRSETENEGLSSKSLRRLFPCNTSMVVIIDDRADVWEWSPNLVKVVPYDFFVGIGDINGAFLPKRSALDSAHPGDTKEGPPVDTVLASSIEPGAEQEEEPSDGITEEHSEAAVARQQAAEATQTKVLEEQLADRPLSKMQEVLHAAAVDKQKATSVEHGTDDRNGAIADIVVEIPASRDEAVAVENDAQTVAGEEAVLKDDDRELDRIRDILRRIHRDFYDTADTDRDVKAIIPEMKRSVLDGVGILFSGVIPLNTQPQQSELWKLCLHFGASCYDKLSNRVTHVVAAKSDTVKVNAARRRPDVTIVWAAWVFDSIALWRRQEESGYLIESDRPFSPQAIDPEPPDQEPKVVSDESDFDADRDVESRGIPVDLNWADADREIDAMLNETDESDIEGTATVGVKRSRSTSRDPELGTPPGSPLSKRKRLAGVRQSSKLKLSFDASGRSTEPSPRSSPPPTARLPQSPDGTSDSDDAEFAALADGLEAGMS